MGSSSFDGFNPETCSNVNLLLHLLWRMPALLRNCSGQFLPTSVRCCDDLTRCLSYHRIDVRLHMAIRLAVFTNCSARFLQAAQLPGCSKRNTSRRTKQARSHSLCFQKRVVSSIRLAVLPWNCKSNALSLCPKLSATYHGPLSGSQEQSCLARLSSHLPTSVSLPQRQEHYDLPLHLFKRMSVLL